MMRFDGPTLAHAWLAVATASGTDKEFPGLYRTVIVEEYPHSVRLYATDRFMLLTAAVPAIEDDLDTGVIRPPTIDEQPSRVVVVRDADGLAKHLLGHVLALARRIDKDGAYVYGMLEMELTFDVRPPPDHSPDDSIEGLEPQYAVLGLPDVEQVYLEVIDTEPPPWRPIFHSFTGEETKQITLNPEVVERLGKVRRHAEGPLVWKFGGAGRVALVEWPDSEPRIEGAFVPRKDRDDETTDPDTPPDPHPEEPPF